MRHEVVDGLAQRVDGARLAHVERLARHGRAAVAGELEEVGLLERVVGADLDALAAEDAAALVEVVAPEEPRVGLDGARGARLGALAAAHAADQLQRQVVGGADDGVEAAAHVVVAARPDLHAADAHAAAAIDAAVGLAHDEVVAEVGRVVVGVAAVEAVLEDLVLDAVPLQVALAVGRAVAVAGTARRRARPRLR